jgi:hypothetical protein
MDEWWAEIGTDILGSLGGNGAMTPARVRPAARHLRGSDDIYPFHAGARKGRLVFPG